MILRYSAHSFIDSAFENYFLQAQRVRQLVCADFNRVFRTPNFFSPSPNKTSPSDSSNADIDVIIHLSAIRTAPPLAPSIPISDPESASSGLDTYIQDVLTVPASLAGLPALSVPLCEGKDGWPVGVSVVGQWGSDEFVLRVGKIMEDIDVSY